MPYNTGTFTMSEIIQTLYIFLNLILNLILIFSHISPQRDMSTEAKKARVQTTMRMLKDEPVPDGYLRFK